MRCHIHIKDMHYVINADIRRIKCIIWWENPLTGNIQRSEGLARCAPEDTYDETLGKRIAEGRAKIKMWAAFTENAIYVRQRIKRRNDKFIEHEINHINNLIYNFDKPNM